MVWNLFRDLDRLRREMNLWMDSERPSGWSPYLRAGGPPVNVFESPEEYVVTLEAPGADREKFDVALTAGDLSVRGAYAPGEEQGNPIRSERPSGAFARVVRLGDRVDPNAIHAEYKRGVLTVRVGKTEQARPKRIEVKVD